MVSHRTKNRMMYAILCRMSFWRFLSIKFTEFFRDKEEALKEIVSWKSIEGAYLDIVVHPDRDFGIHRVLLRGNDVGFWGAIGIDVLFNFWNPQMVKGE